MCNWLQDVWANHGKGKSLHISVMSVAFFLLGWEFLVYIFEIKIVILPAPSLILEALYAYFLSGRLLIDVAASARRVFFGLSLGTIFGVGVGLLIGWYPRIRAALNPLVAATFPIPKIALVPLMIIWFGLGDSYKVVLILSGVFYIMLTNTVTGVNGIDEVIIMACKNLGASDGEIFRKVVIPGSLPIIFAALRISFSVSLILAIAAEMINAEVGIGHFIVYAGQLLETEKVFAGLILTGILGLIGYQLIAALERRLLPWCKKPGR